MHTERREVRRERLHMRASVVFNGRQSMFDCAIRNSSDAGALLRLTDWVALPSTFVVETPGEPDGRRVRQCWRRGDDVGVAFLTAQECQPDAPLDLAAFRARRTAEATR